MQSPTDVLIDDLFARPDGITLALVVQQRGDVVAERYGVQPENIFQPELEITAESTLTSWSMAKSITHAAVGLLVADGLIDVDAPAAVPEWAGTDKAEITLLQLLEMRSGLRFVEDYVDDGVSHCLEMLFGESGPSHAAYAAALPLDHEPGTVYNYSSGTTNIIARIIGDVVSGGPDDKKWDIHGRRDLVNPTQCGYCTLSIFPDKSSNVVVINYFRGFNGSRIAGRH